MNFIKVRNEIIKGLEDYIACPVLLSDQISEIPEYPYCYYSVLTFRISNKSFGLRRDIQSDADFITCREEPVKGTISFTFCSQNRENAEQYIFGEDEALELANKAIGYFLLQGHHTQTDYGNIVIQNIGSVSNRSGFHVDDTVRRFGFDITFSYIRRDIKVSNRVLSVKQLKDKI